MRASGLLFAWFLIAGPALAADEAPRVAGSEVPVPKRLKFVAPEYPPEAQARGLRGIVILDLTIDVKGKVSGVEVTRSVPPFDDAARAAVQQWEYEVTKVNGKAVSVRLTVPITFALKLPDMKREDGIPELRQGAGPGIPPSDSPGNHTVVAELTIAGDGQLVEGGVVEGESPWAEALLLAVRTWRFAPTSDGEALHFKLNAEFVAAGGTDKPAVVTLALSEPKKVAGDTAATATAAEPSPASPPPPDASQPQPTAAASPTPVPTPAPPASTETAQAPPAAPAIPVPGPSAGQAPRAPDIEVISPAPPPPTPAPEGPEGLGVSAVRDVKVEPGLPDLVRGRRPVVPPLARIDQIGGTVDLRFAVDSSGGTSHVEAKGPDILRDAAALTVQSWAFRRTKADRLYLTASFVYAGDLATASVKPADPTATP